MYDRQIHVHLAWWLSVAVGKRVATNRHKISAGNDSDVLRLVDIDCKINLTG